MPPSLPVWIHVGAALSALILGGLLLWRPLKGDALHRTLGWSWVALMLTVAISSLWIPGFMRLSWIHVFTLITLVALPRGIYRARTGNIEGHRRTMTGIFSGGLVIAGLLALAPGRALNKALATLLFG